MIQLQAVYNLPFTSIVLADWFLNQEWLPEVPFCELETDAEDQFLSAVNTEQRLQVREHIGQTRGHSYAGLHTLWFDGAPVCIIRSNGYWDREDIKRWITNPRGYTALVEYLRSKMAVPEPDVVDSNTELYEEELFYINGKDFSKEFGYEIAPAAKGFLLIYASRGLLPTVSDTTYLIEIHESVQNVPKYVRRGACVLKYVRPVSDEEHAANPRIRDVSEERGYTRHILYEASERPLNEEVVSI